MNIVERRRRDAKRKREARKRPEVRERERLAHRKYRQTHSEACRERDRKYNLEHLKEREAYQKVYRILNKEKCNETEKLCRRRQRSTNPMIIQRDRATAIVHYYNPTMWECEACESIAKLQFHHEDYSRPLAVMTICHKCHTAITKAKIII